MQIFNLPLHVPHMGVAVLHLMLQVPQGLSQGLSSCTPGISYKGAYNTLHGVNVSSFVVIKTFFPFKSIECAWCPTRTRVFPLLFFN